MGPQPLSRVKRNASTKFDPDIHLSHPDLAVYPMAVISRWARTDAMFAELLSAMLKSTDLAVGMAMYQALTGGDSRRAALAAAAAESLSDEDCWLMDAVIRVNKPSRDQRNAFAHNLWGVSSDVPNALLLVDPTIFVRHLTVRGLYSQGTLAMLMRYQGTGKPMPSGDLDHSKVQVWRKSGLKRAAQAAADAGTNAFLLNIAVDRIRYPDSAGTARQLLLGVPAIRQAFEALSRGRKKEAPLQRHLKTRHVKR
jgi:hypothetical protein